METITRKDRQMIAVLLIGTLISSLSQGMMAPALARISAEFAISSAQSQMLTTTFTLVMGILTIALATLIKRANTKKLFCITEVIFLAGCIIVLSAQNFYLLLVGRILQAFGAGIMNPLLTTVTLMLYPKERYGRAMGMIGLFMGISPAIAPTLAGLFIDTWGWRSIFAMLSVLTVISIILGLFMVKDVSTGSTGKVQIPWLLVYAVAAYGLILASTNIKTYGILSSRTLAAFGIAIILLVIFVRKQLKSDSPLMNVRLFTHRTFTIGIIFGVIAYSMNLSQTMIFSLYIQRVLGQSATASGLILLPGTLLLPIFNPIAGRLYDRFGARKVLSTGFTMLLLGSVLGILLMGEGASFAVIAVIYMIRAVGIDLLLYPLTAYTVSAVPGDQVAQATSISSSVRMLGSSILSSIFVVIISVCSANGVIDVHGMQCSFAVQAVILLLSLFAAVFLLRGAKKQS